MDQQVWSETGFLSNLGVLDFPGGTPLHIFSGTTATALSIYPSYPLFRSKRSFARTPSHLALHRPGNSLFQLLSLVTIWNSWLAFDAGTTLSFNFKSIMALCVTNLCASGGAFTWICMTYYETGKWSLDSTFMGAISGLVLITPSAGFIDMPTASCFGIGGAVICRQALRIKSTNLAQRLRWVDNGDTFATHTKAIATYDGVTIIDGGVFFDDDTRQLGVQLLEALIGFTWSFVGNYVLFALIDCVPGLEALTKDRTLFQEWILRGRFMLNVKRNIIPSKIVVLNSTRKPVPRKQTRDASGNHNEIEQGSMCWYTSEEEEADFQSQVPPCGVSRQSINAH
ncbi:related to ammonia permease [Rhynchosporium agropyri]|uniref:Related to ammonia permease n=1 Tax=Rhynchosporium agropyri TaxID=914238 RepID=A0A1E1L5P2_9HELO|nr:related to ammonia permease [Rhynchosporium agropyri]